MQGSNRFVGHDTADGIASYRIGPKSRIRSHMRAKRHIHHTVCVAKRIRCSINYIGRKTHKSPRSMSWIVTRCCIMKSHPCLIKVDHCLFRCTEAIVAGTDIVTEISRSKPRHLQQGTRNLPIPSGFISWVQKRKDRLVRKGTLSRVILGSLKVVFQTTSLRKHQQGCRG